VRSDSAPLTPLSAANTILRSLTAATFPLWVEVTLVKWGIGWAVSLQGFVAVALMFVPLIFIRYGKTCVRLLSIWTDPSACAHDRAMRRRRCGRSKSRRSLRFASRCTQVYMYNRQDSREKEVSPPCSAARRNLSSIGARTVTVSRPSCACQLGRPKRADGP